jgi:hypothetical protein
MMLRLLKLHGNAVSLGPALGLPTLLANWFPVTIF